MSQMEQHTIWATPMGHVVMWDGDIFKDNCDFALAGWLSLLDHCPVHQNVVGSVPVQGTHN